MRPWGSYKTGVEWTPKWIYSQILWHVTICYILSPLIALHNLHNLHFLVATYNLSGQFKAVLHRVRDDWFLRAWWSTTLILTFSILPLPLAGIVDYYLPHWDHSTRKNTILSWFLLLHLDAMKKQARKEYQIVIFVQTM